MILGKIRLKCGLLPRFNLQLADDCRFEVRVKQCLIHFILIRAERFIEIKIKFLWNFIGVTQKLIFEKSGFTTPPLPPFYPEFRLKK